MGVTKKFGPLSENIRGRRIVLVDDSIVRGVTMTPIVNLLRAEGAKEVHIRIASPPIKYPCYMGINIPTRKELVANNIQQDKFAEYFGADSLHYLTVEGLQQAVVEGIKGDGLENTGHCVACLTGNYPTDLDWWGVDPTICGGGLKTKYSLFFFVAVI